MAFPQLAPVRTELTFTLGLAGPSRTDRLDTPPAEWGNREPAPFRTARDPDAPAGSRLSPGRGEFATIAR